MYDYQRARFLIEQELALFPLTTLRDIYKLFFQNCHGSGHFMEDLSFIKEHINRELHQIDLSNYQYPEYDISYLFKITRVSLISILLGKYDTNYIADKFLELASNHDILTISEWEKEWTEIMKLTLEIYPKLTDDLSHANIDLSNSLHHSEIYRKNYNPHYRICSL